MHTWCAHALPVSKPQKSSTAHTKERHWARSERRVPFLDAGMLLRQPYRCRRSCRSHKRSDTVPVALRCAVSLFWFPPCLMMPTAQSRGIRDRPIGERMGKGERRRYHRSPSCRQHSSTLRVSWHSEDLRLTPNQCPFSSARLIAVSRVHHIARTDRMP